MPTHCRWYGWSSLQSIYLVSGRNLWQLWSWCWRYLCRWFGEGEWFRAFSQARNAHYGWLAEFCFAIIKCKRLEFQEVLSLLEWYLVSLIIALLISGLVIDLGGGPNHERIGFRVSDKLNTNMASLICHSSVLAQSRRNEPCSFCQRSWCRSFLSMAKRTRTRGLRLSGYGCCCNVNPIPSRPYRNWPMA